ncbi:MAG TPA: hypothetical protein VJQ46_09545 [Gemmatimonadales bacterium]|nr:hypothetical protein [Gemmatimonadales bacterium]
MPGEGRAQICFGWGRNANSRGAGVDGARAYVVTGQPEKAIDELEQLLKVPYHLTPAWLRIDPTWDPLRSNPRFKRLVEGGATPAA